MVLLTMLCLAVLLYWIGAGLFLKVRGNKQHNGIYYVNALTCYMVLLAMLCLAVLLYWICAESQGK